MMRCYNCGVEVSEEDIQCPNCNVLLTENKDRYDIGMIEEPQPQFSSLRRKSMETEAAKKKDDGKKKKDWIQKAVTPEEKGKFTDWCKKRGYKGVSQSCIDEAIAAGGKAAQMANFAISVSKKYKHPGKKKKKAEMLSQLVRLADILDTKGLSTEATELDTVIQEVSQDTSYESTGDPISLEEFAPEIIGEEIDSEEVDVQ